MIRLLALLASLAFSLPALADPTAVIIDDSRPGSYIVTVGSGGQVTVQSIKIVTPSSVPWQPPSNPTTPTNPKPSPSEFSKEVTRLTKQVLDGGGDKTTAAGIASVYSLVAGQVAAGEISVDRAPDALRAGTSAVLAVRSDSEKWTAFRTTLSQSLTTLQDQGHLATAEQFSGILYEVAIGMNTASGFKGNPQALVRLDPNQLPAARADAGLAGLDLAQIIELIKLILEVMKAFKS